MNRLIAIGDIHGELKKLNKLLKKLDIKNEDTIVFLGDYIDRGSDSRGVINRLLDLSGMCHCEFLMGNHEYYFLQTLNGVEWAKNYFYEFGGQQTIKSYGGFENIYKTHSKFFNLLKTYYATDKYFFVHAGIRPDKTLEEQDKLDMLLIRDNFICHKHKLPQKIIFGHTPFEVPYVEDDKIGIDTGCGKFANAPLTAYICTENKFLKS